MGHGPSIGALSVHRLLGFAIVVFEWISCSCSLPGKYLFISRFVMLGLCIECPLRDRWKPTLARLFEVLAVSTTFGLARNRVVMRPEDLLQKVDDLWSDL